MIPHGISFVLEMISPSKNFCFCTSWRWYVPLGQTKILWRKGQQNFATTIWFWKIALGKNFWWKYLGRGRPTPLGPQDLQMERPGLGNSTLVWTKKLYLQQSLWEEIVHVLFALPPKRSRHSISHSEGNWHGTFSFFQFLSHWDQKIIFHFNSTSHQKISFFTPKALYRIIFVIPVVLFLGFFSKEQFTSVWF